VTALEHHLKLRPADFTTHHRLFDTYQQTNNLDKAAEHLQAAIRSATASVLRRGDDKDGRKSIEGLQQELDALNAESKERGEKFDVGATDLALREKAQALVQLGLHKRALDLLLQADSAQIDREEASMQLNLLLAVGQPELVRQRFQEVEGLKEV